jgi:hypothetical protein
MTVGTTVVMTEVTLVEMVSTDTLGTQAGVVGAARVVVSMVVGATEGVQTGVVVFRYTTDDEGAAEPVSVAVTGQIVVLTEMVSVTTASDVVTG